MLKYLTAEMGLSEARESAWYAHWIAEGFNALEALLPEHDGWCVGITPTLADCCLVPQVANAERMKMDLSAWPRIRRIAAFARLHPAFLQAEPQRQPDYIPPETRACQQARAPNASSSGASARIFSPSSSV